MSLQKLHGNTNRTNGSVDIYSIDQPVQMLRLFIGQLQRSAFALVLFQAKMVVFIGTVFCQSSVGESCEVRQTQKRGVMFFLGFTTGIAFPA
jgi:hypothetical protein